MPCPHGISDPLPVIFPLNKLEKSHTGASHVQIILDSRECWLCLRRQIEQANELLKLVSGSRSSLHPYLSMDIFKKWIDYVARYNP